MDESLLFAEALKFTTPAERAAFLHAACGGNSQLHADMEALLQAHADDPNFLERPAALLGGLMAPAPGPAADGRVAEPRATDPQGTETPPMELPGAVVAGRYKLLEQIGEGGFGVVFMAEQIQPIRRKVALKVLKPGMDTRQVVARFETERQTLAILDHPHIAKVFDGGVTASGRPYFVMELVKGVPITDSCDQNHLALPQRLELFVSVCQAVQHAHQKSIIHRDLKPSNVLVTMHDTLPVVKVIDFGVAKALGQALTDKTLFTGFVQLIGTPLYMSPEQAGQSGLDIDTRSDIYSLGVLLYELLTGTTPFTRERFKQAAYDEIRRIICEEEPPKPSTRLSESKDTLASISAQRQMEPVKLTKVVRGELDWIVMKALEKDRNRRYETANGFARDVQRYLAGEAVQACPPSTWYRFRKFVWRNKAAVTTAMALILAALVAAVTLAVTNVMIRREQARTEDEKVLAEAAQKLAEDRAEEIRQEMESLKAANALLDRGRWYAGQRRWDDAHAAFTKAIEMRWDHVSVWVERGDLYTRLGLWDLAAADYAREMEWREPDTTFRWYQHALLRLHLGDTDGYHQTCRKMRQRFHGTLNRGFVEELVRSSLLAPDPDADLPWLVELAQKIAAHQPWSALYVLGTAHYRAGQFDQAIQRLKEALATKSQLAIRLLSHPVLAMAYHRLGRAAEARQSLHEAAKILDQWIQERYLGQREHWVTHQGAEAAWPVPWWDYLEGQLIYREAKVLIDGSPPPDDPRLHVLRARALAGLRWPTKAVAEYDAALKLTPDDLQIRLEMLRNRGYSFAHRREWELAADQFAQACELQPDDSYLWRYRAVACFASGNLAAYRAACAAIFERFKTVEGGPASGNVLLACLLRDDALLDMTVLLRLCSAAEPIWHWGAWARGAALYRAGRYAESIRGFEEAAKLYRPRAWDWCFLAMAHQRLGHPEKARRCLGEAARWIDEANKEDMDDPTGTRPAWGDWHEPVVYPLLLREAEALVAGEAGSRRRDTVDGN